MLVRGAECYVGRNDNPSFGACVLFFVSASSRFIQCATCDVVGSETLEELADTVWRAVGPSGRNKVLCAYACDVM